MSEDTPTDHEDPSDGGDAPAFPILSPLQARVVAVLYEKQHTVPDTYPMSLNALRSGVNQKTSRDPLMSASEAEIAGAIDELRGLSLVIESSGSRTMRYEQNIRRVVDMPGASVALLATLILRGPQTTAELRMNSERLYRFTDTSSVEAFLRELNGRRGGALVQELARRPGERERRWAQLWTGPVADAGVDPEVAISAHRAGAPGTGSSGSASGHGGGGGGTKIADEIAELRGRIEKLERTIALLMQSRDE